MYIPKINEYLKILNEEEVEDFVAINVCERFKSIREGQNLRKVVKLLYIFLTTPHEVEKYVKSNSLNNCLYRDNVEILNIFDP